MITSGKIREYFAMLQEAVRDHKSYFKSALKVVSVSNKKKTITISLTSIKDDTFYFIFNESVDEFDIKYQAARRIENIGSDMPTTITVVESEIEEIARTIQDNEDIARVIVKLAERNNFAAELWDKGGSNYILYHVLDEEERFYLAVNYRGIYIDREEFDLTKKEMPLVDLEKIERDFVKVNNKVYDKA